MSTTIIWFALESVIDKDEYIVAAYLLELGTHKPEGSRGNSYGEFNFNKHSEACHKITEDILNYELNEL